MISIESWPKGLIVFDFFRGTRTERVLRIRLIGFPGEARVRRVNLKVFEHLDSYELDIYADDDVSRPWSMSFPNNTVLIVKEAAL